MPPRLLAFDLDGTLLSSDKRLSDANREALLDMQRCGAIVALASGRLRSSMMRYVRELGIDTAMLALNGAAVYATSAPDVPPVHSLDLPQPIASELIAGAQGKDLVVNVYRDDRVYAVRDTTTAPWIDLYYRQTSSEYRWVESYSELLDRAPAKIIFVGDPSVLDHEEQYYRAHFGRRVYIVRTWDYYLEFLHPEASKGSGIRALARFLDVPLSQTAAFGDAANDIPMLEIVGYPVAMANAETAVKEAAGYVSPWSNDEDGVAREWERLKAL